MRVLRTAFGPKRENAAEGWRKLHNEEHHNLYFSVDSRAVKSRRMSRVRHVINMTHVTNAYRI
jgi:hypothetical protein